MRWGQLKIDFPNKHAIYMHDTPQKHLFTREQRAFSHRCVRLQRPREMAAALLGVSVADIDRKIARGETQTERVRGYIPVYLAYFTAWPDAQGTVRYYKDVYGRDAHLALAIAKTCGAPCAMIYSGAHATPSCVSGKAMHRFSRANAASRYTFSDPATSTELAFTRPGSCSLSVFPLLGRRCGASLNAPP